MLYIIRHFLKCKVPMTIFVSSILSLKPNSGLEHNPVFSSYFLTLFFFFLLFQIIFSGYSVMLKSTKFGICFRQFDDLCNANGSQIL